MSRRCAVRRIGHALHAFDDYDVDSAYDRDILDFSFSLWRRDMHLGGSSSEHRHVDCRTIYSVAALKRSGRSFEEIDKDGWEIENQLQQQWHVWVQLHKEGESGWQGSTMQIHTIIAIEDCHRLFGNARSPSKFVAEKLVLGDEDESADAADIFVVKKGVIPSRDACADGGQWIAQLSTMKPERFNELWLNLVIAVVLAVDMGGDHILGAVASCQPENSKMAIWMSGRAECNVSLVGQAFTNLLQQFGVCKQIRYDSFADSLAIPLESSSVIAKACETKEAIEEHDEAATVQAPNGFSKVVLDTGQCLGEALHTLRPATRVCYFAEHYRVVVNKTFINIESVIGSRSRRRSRSI